MKTTVTKKKNATIFDFEQIDLFEFLDELKSQDVIIQPKTTTQFFTFKPGTAIYLDYWLRDKYKVVSDDGETTVCRRINTWDNTIEEKETLVKSKDVYAIAEPHFIPLPRIQRKGVLDLDEYKAKQQKFIASMSEETKMDLIVYTIALSLMYDFTDEFIRIVQEGLIKQAAAFLHSKSDYIRPLGSYGTMSVHKRYDTPFCVSYGNNVNFEDENYEPLLIVEHFLNLLERVNTKSIEDLTVFELILHYRLNGLKLMYAIETDEWWVSHPHSTRRMPIEGGRKQLNNFQQVAEAYDEFSVLSKQKKSTNQSPTLDIFEDSEDVLPVVEATGFQLPKGAQVHCNYNEYFCVLEDDGEKALVIKTTHLGKILDETPIEFPSNSFRGAYTSKNRYIRLPRFHRPSDLTLEKIYERGIKHFEDLTKKEATDLAVIQWTSMSNSVSSSIFLRAYYENDRKAMEDQLKRRNTIGCGGKFKPELHSSISLPFEVVLSTSQAIKHFEQMIENIETKPTSALSLYELQLAYRLKGYLLTYCPETQEYELAHIRGRRKIFFAKGRYAVNSIDESIRKHEDWIAAC